MGQVQRRFQKYICKFKGNQIWFNPWPNFIFNIHNLPINRPIQEAETVLFASDTDVLIKAENETL